MLDLGIKGSISSGRGERPNGQYTTARQNWTKRAPGSPMRRKEMRQCHKGSHVTRVKSAGMGPLVTLEGGSGHARKRQPQDQ